MVQIVDPQSQLGAGVSSEGLETDSVILSRWAYFARKGTAWTVDSATIDIDATDTMLFVKNTGAKIVYLDWAIINGSNAICEWTLGLGSATTTPAGGTVLAFINANHKFSSDTPDAVSRSDETAVATATTSLRFWTTIAGTAALPLVHNLEGFILGQNHYAQFTQVTESTSGSVTLGLHTE